MKYLKNKFILISITLNIIFLITGGYFIHQRGGIPYLLTKVSAEKAIQASQNVMLNSPFYLERKSLFEILPKSNNDIFFVGDSITQGGDWSELFNNPNIKNRGISGDTTTGILSRIDNIIISKPTKIFLLVGVNDIRCGKSTSEIVADYDKILETLTKRLPDTKIYVESVLPINNDVFDKIYPNPNLKNNDKILALNEELKKLSEKYNLTYVDIYSVMVSKDQQLIPNLAFDGIHLSREGFLLFKDSIAMYVK